MQEGERYKIIPPRKRKRKEQNQKVNQKKTFRERIDRQIEVLARLKEAMDMSDPSAASRMIAILGYELKECGITETDIREMRKNATAGKERLMTPAAERRLTHFRKMAFPGAGNELYDGDVPAVIAARFPLGVAVEYLKGNIVFSQDGVMEGALDMCRLLHAFAEYVTPGLIMRMAVGSFTLSMPKDPAKLSRYMKEGDRSRLFLREYRKYAHGFSTGLSDREVVLQFREMLKAYYGGYAYLRRETAGDLNAIMRRYAEEHPADMSMASERLIAAIEKADHEMRLSEQYW